MTVFPSYKSTADLSVFFLDRAVQVTRQGGLIGLLTPNKWFRAEYAQPLRSRLRNAVRVHLLVDFGHSRNLFPDADTFPAAVTVEPVLLPTPDTELLRFVKAHDRDREHDDLAFLVRGHSILVPHSQLRSDRWELEDVASIALWTDCCELGCLLRTTWENRLFGAY